MSIERLPEKSLCELHQEIIVSRERRENREHIAHNSNGEKMVRHFRLDGELVKQETCCDFLLLNDTDRHAYYIELKGKQIKKAVEQLLAGERLCRNVLPKYDSFFRIVASKSPTHNTFPKNYQDLLKRVGIKRCKCKTRKMEETL